VHANCNCVSDTKLTCTLPFTHANYSIDASTSCASTSCASDATRKQHLHLLIMHPYSSTKESTMIHDPSLADNPHSITRTRAPFSLHITRTNDRRVQHHIQLAQLNPTVTALGACGRNWTAANACNMCIPPAGMSHASHACGCSFYCTAHLGDACYASFKSIYHIDMKGLPGKKKPSCKQPTTICQLSCQAILQISATAT